MRILPARDSLPGIGIYYINLVVFIVFCVYAWSNPTMAFVVLVILSFVTLIFQDVVWLKQCYLAPQDKALIERITAQFEEYSTRELLTGFDFQQYSVHERDLNNLEVIKNEWVGVDYEFSNRNYQKIWDSMKDHINQLLDILHTHADYFNAHNFSISKSGQGGAANQHRDEIWRLYQQLRRIYIQKMPYA